MATPRQPFQLKLRAVALGMIFSAAGASIAFGDRPDVKPLIAKVDPAIGRISTDCGNGWGCVVDAAKGWVATNYHVMAGATDAHVTFPGAGGKPCPVEGLVATMPGKDLALIRIQAGDGKLHALRLADKPAAKGDAVFAGVPLGLPGVLSSGTVAAVSSGREVSNLIAKLGNVVYYEGLGLDPDAVWLQVVARISPGKDGGPLVNAAGELVGLMTFRYDTGPGDNLNYAVSVAHLKRLMATAGTKVQPLWKPLLPIPSYSENPAKGDLEETLTAWKKYNSARGTLQWELGWRKEGRVIRYPRGTKAGPSMYQFARAWHRHVANVMAAYRRKADPELKTLLVTEAEAAESLASGYGQISMFGTDALGAANAKRRLAEIDTIESGLERAIQRGPHGGISHKYNQEFPAVEETSEEAGAARAQAGTQAAGKNQAPAASGSRAEFRVWTSHWGRSVKAKLLGVSDGKVNLERTDGKVISVPLDKLSEADRLFVNDISPWRKPAK